MYDIIQYIEFNGTSTISIFERLSPAKRIRHRLKNVLRLANSKLPRTQAEACATTERLLPGLLADSKIAAHIITHVRGGPPVLRAASQPRKQQHHDQEGDDSGDP